MNFSHVNKIPAERQYKLFVFDMDSTLIDAEVINELAKIAGVSEQVSQITTQAMSGEMDYTESFQMRVALLNGLSYEKALSIKDHIQLMAGAKELIQFIQSVGGKTAMITCGFSLIAEDVQKKLDIDYVYSNDLAVKDGILTGQANGPLMTTNSKANVLDELVEKLNISYEECAVVGDGANDICLFEKAGFSVAFNAKPLVQKQACAVVQEKDLRNIIPILKSAMETPQSQPCDTPQKPARKVFREGGPSMMKELQTRKAELKTVSEEAKDKRNQLNAEASKYAAERNELNNKTKELITAAQDIKIKRDEVNINVSKYKTLRDETNAKSNELFAKADSLRKDSNLGGPSIKEIRKQIDNLEFEQQTHVLTPKKEKEIVTKIKELEDEYAEKKRQLDENSELKSILDEAQVIRDEASEYHNQLAVYAAQAQEFHEQMITAFKEADKVRAESDASHKNFIRAQEAADEQHKIFIEAQKEIREIDKESGKAKKKEKDPKAKVEKEENEKGAKELFDKFKDGGKLTMEDLMAIQRSKY